MKNKAAQALGSLGGKARAKKLTEEQRRAIAMKGVEARKAKRKANKNYDQPKQTRSL